MKKIRCSGIKMFAMVGTNHKIPIEFSVVGIHLLN